MRKTKVLFIGEGLADYAVCILNKLHGRSEVEIFNAICKPGSGNVPSGVRQTREGATFPIIELTNTVVHRLSNQSFWSFQELERTLREIRPDIVCVSLKYLKAFTNDPCIAAVVSDLAIQIITNDNPRNVEPYEEKKKAIQAGHRDDDFLPWYTQYFLSLCEKVGMRDTRPLQKKLLIVLGSTGLLTRYRRRKILLKKLEEMKEILHVPAAHIGYNERAIDVYTSYGIPREKVFIKYNSPDTDLLFSIREKIEQEPQLLPSNPHRIIHIGRLASFKRIDMIIQSFAEVKKEVAYAELYILGQGPEEEPLKALVKKLELEDAVHFTGWVDQSMMGRYLLSSAFCVLAGMGGLSINDAMAFGRPVLCSIADGTEKHLVIERLTGMYFKNGDGDDLTEKMKYLLAHPQLTDSMGRNATDVIKNKINIHTTIGAYLQAFSYALRSR